MAVFKMAAQICKNYTSKIFWDDNNHFMIDFDKNLYTYVFVVADNNLSSDFKNSKWWIQYGGRNFQKSTDSGQISSYGVFFGRSIHILGQVYKILKIKMADTKWRIQNGG